MITRSEALKIAQELGANHNPPMQVDDDAIVSDGEELARHGIRGPRVWSRESLEGCWYVYVSPSPSKPARMITPSTFIAIDKATGRVVYAGPAGDEG